MDVRQQWLVVNNVRMYICNYTYLLAFYTHIYMHIYIYISMYFDASFCVFTSCVFLFLSASSSSCVLCVFMWVHAFYVSLSCFMCLDVS